MKQLIVIFLLALFGLKAFPQDVNVIKLKSEATLTLTKTTNGQYTYKIVEIKKFNKSIKIMGNDLLKDKVDSNQVRLFFFKGDFGGTDKIALVIKSGLKVPVKYTAKIKVDGSDQFIITDVEPLFPNVKSVEEWQDNIVEIILEDFTFYK